jgi:hypothetical protein
MTATENRRIKAATDRLAEAIEKHVAGETKRLSDYIQHLEESRAAWIEHAAELLGMLDVAAPLSHAEADGIESQRTELSDELRARFDEVRRESREAEASGANAKLRRAS